MNEIVIPNIGTVSAADLSYLLRQLDRANGMLHDNVLTDEEFIQVSTTVAEAVRSFFKHKVKHTESISHIRPLHRNTDSDGQERFCQNISFRH